MTSLVGQKRAEVCNLIEGVLKVTKFMKRQELDEILMTAYDEEFIQRHHNAIDHIIKTIKRNIRETNTDSLNTTQQSLNRSSSTSKTHPNTPDNNIQQLVTQLDEAMIENENEWILSNQSSPPRLKEQSTPRYNQLYSNEIMDTNNLKQNIFEQSPPGLSNNDHRQNPDSTISQADYLKLLDGTIYEGRDIIEIIVQRHIQYHRGYLAQFELYQGLARIAGNWDKIDPLIPGFVLPRGVPLYSKLTHRQNNFRDQLCYINMLLRTHPSLLRNCTDPLRWFYVELYHRGVRTLDESYIALSQNEGIELKLMIECVQWIMAEDPSMQHFNYMSLLDKVTKSTRYNPTDNYEYSLQCEYDTLPYQEAYTTSRQAMSKHRPD